MTSPRIRSKRFQFLYGWLIVGVLFYVVDCFVATSFPESSLDLPWFERGIYAGGPFGILLTIGWLVFPVCRVVFKRIKTRPQKDQDQAARLVDRFGNSSVCGCTNRQSQSFR
jgi:hypothetical protein